MGSPPDEMGRRDNEGPPTTVHLTHGYWLAENPVTVAQYVAILGKAERMHGELNRVTNAPVVGVSWQKADRFCQLLTARERAHGGLPDGLVYRLPTEAEREYACRAGTTTAFYFGALDQDALDSCAWYEKNSDAMPHNVRTRQPNPWGLFDMNGNVVEWCQDCLNISGDTATDPVGEMNGQRHVLRGGAWDYPASRCRSAFRHDCIDGNRCMEAGFRLALAPELLPAEGH